VNTTEKGRIGEDLAERYLVGRGFKILARNAGCRFGEIDVIARQGDRLYFVEIRRRTGTTYGPALLSITPSKIAKLRRTAEHLLFVNREWQKLVPFFSVIAIDEDEKGEPSIEFLPDAFQ
jgi:putative endonuclease